MYKLKSKSSPVDFPSIFSARAFEPGHAVLSNPPKPNHPDEPSSGSENLVASQRQAQAGSGKVASVADASDQLVKLQQQLHRLQRTVRLAIEAELLKLSGQSFGALAANQAVVLMIQEMLEAHGLRVRCPECGHPAILRCSGRPGVVSGAFVLDHTIEGQRTFHGGYAALPVLQLVAKPPRRTAKKAS
ncbi:MAG: hypothetical protein ACO1RT_15400 [Planctomycetaceae bacterium]